MPRTLLQHVLTVRERGNFLQSVAKRDVENCLVGALAYVRAQQLLAEIEFEAQAGRSTGDHYLAKQMAASVELPDLEPLREVLALLD